MKFKSKFKKLIASVLSAACVATTAFGISGCMPKSVDKTEPTDMNVRNDRLAPPTDGSLPTAYSAVENLAYIVGKFDSQTQYHSYTEGVTAASIATQVTRNWKDYKNGVLMNSDVTYSSMVKGGTQTCTVFGKDEEGNPVADTYFRTSETPKQDTTSTSAAWKQDAPTYFSENAYLYTYGFLPNELFNYAVNADTVVSSEEIKVEANGTYTLKFSLDPVGSTFYYQFGMKTRGGLSDFPEFKFIEMTVNFNSDWQINTCDVHEVSNVNKGIVVSSVSDFTTVYYYGEDNFDNEHFGYYENYYKKYLGDGSLEQGGDSEEKLVMDVTNVLSNGFANILNGGQQFEIVADLGANKYVGYVFLGLDLADIAGSINLKASLGKTLNAQDLYVEYANGKLAAYYGDDFAIQANLAAAKLYADQFGEIINKITSAISPSQGGATLSEGGSAETDGADPLTALMDSMVLTAGENQAVLTLKTDDLLGLGIGIDANLVFGINGNKITFRGADIRGLSIGGEVIDLSLGLKTTTTPLISRNPSKTPTDLATYVADVYSLLSSDLIKVSAILNGDSDKVALSALKGVNVQVDAYADLGGIALGADATASYTYNGNTISAKVGVIYEYNQNTGKYGNAYLSLKEFNGTPYNINVRCDINELIVGISALLQNAGASNTVETGKIVSVINGALSSDFSSLLTEMYADGSKIKIGVSVDTVLDMLGVDAGVEFGSCTLAYEKGEGIHGGSLSANLPSIGFGMTVCGEEGELEKSDDNDYLDLSEILTDVKAFIDAKAVAVGLSFDGSKLTAVNVPELANLKATATAYVDFKTGLAAQIVANVEYGNITAQITASYIYDSATNGTVVLSLDSLCGVERNVNIYCNVNEVVEGVKTLMSYFGTAQTAVQTTNTGIDLNTVLANLLTADISAIIPNLEANSNVLNLSVNVDEVLKLLNVSLGNVTVGEVALQYTHNGENLLSANLPNFGVVATVNPSNATLPEATTDGALNLKTVLDDVNKILSSKQVAVNLTLDGSKLTAVNVAQLKDLTATATAYVDFKTGLAAQVDADITYKVDGQKTITAKLKVYFNYDKATIGNVMVVLDSINGVKTDIKVKCNVSEIKTAIETLLTYVTPQNGTLASNSTAQTDGATLSASSVLEKLINADFSLLLKDISNSPNTLNLTVNIDEIIKLFNVDIGLTFGDATLTYTHANDGEIADLLSATVADLGVVLTVNPANVELSAPATDDCFDLTKLINVVNGAMSQINTIKTDGKLYFEIAEVADDNTPATYLLLDGIRVQIWGKGEICWVAGQEKVALDLSMSISEAGTDVTTLKFVYDKNGSPMVKLALNGVGMTIYKEDIDGVKKGFIEIYNKLAELLGLQPITADTTATQPTTPAEGTQGTTQNLGSADRLLSVIFGILAKDNWVNELNNFTASCDGTSVALGYLTDKNKANVSINTEGGLSVAYNGAFGERFSLGGQIKVNAAAEGNFAVSFEGCNMASSKDGTTEFIRLAYNYLFECIHGISVENILGSSTYAVRFELNGANTDVASLQNVYIKAEVYITDEVSLNNGKLAEGLLNVNVAGVAVNLHVITEYDASGKAQFYINLTRVADILLPDLKMYATQDSLYETFKVIFNAVTKTNVVDAIKKLLPANGAAGTTIPEQQPATGETQPVAQGTLDKVASILEKLINLNFSKAITAYETNGVQHADIDLDNLLSQFGINVGGGLGSLAVEINHNTHAMTTSGVATVTNAEGVKEDREWISLSSEKTEKRSYNEFKREDYISIEFLPDLISDIVKFATDDSGNMYEKFTLSGSINVNIVSMINLDIDVSTLTVSMADNDFYFSGLLHIKGVNVLIAKIPESTVGISFHNGYLTLAKGVNTQSPEYKIMTMDYFIDHMLVKDGSVLEWWLNISGWDTILSIINKAAGDLNVSSGLTTPQDVYLYEAKTDKEDQEISMYDFVEALRVVIGGNETASFGNIAPLESDLGIYDNYYGFALNAGKITNGVLTKLYAALLRNDNGISGIKASGAIQSYVKFSATLNYEEGLTNEFVMGSNLTSGVVAPSMYAKANEVISAAGATVDYNHFVQNPTAGYDEKFGCFSTKDMSHDYSKVLYQHTLTIVNLDGTKQTRLVRHGSTIYLFDNYSPAYTDESKTFRLLYSTAADIVGETSVVMNDDLTVYAVRRTAVNAIIHNGANEIVVSSFIGDRVPTSVKGLEAIGDVTYADGTIVTATDTIETAEPVHIYGAFAQSEAIINGVKYTFNPDTKEYTVTGRAAGFNAEYCDGDNPATLVLESSIDGYPVTAIGANALANTDGHSLKNVIIPATIVTVGESAFANNHGMVSAVFLAPQVTVLGSFNEGESGNTTPFYGCSATEGGTSTNLKIYYNSVMYEGSDTNLLWTKFCRHEASPGIYHRYYIGCDPRGGIIDYDHNGGGALYSSGWDYVTAVAHVELNGITGTALTEEAAEEILSRYYPVVSESTFTGNAEIENNIAKDLSQFDTTQNGISYKLTYTTEYTVVNGFTTVTYNLAYSAAKTIKVYSNVEFDYYGTKIIPDKSNDVTVDLLIGEVERPTLDTHDLIKWEKSVVDGSEVYTAEWKVKEFKLSVLFKRGFTDTNVGYLNGASKVIRGGASNATEIYNLTIYGGTATFTVQDSVLTIETGDTTYTIYINEATIAGKDKGNKRNISSTVNGTLKVTSDMSLTLSY